MATLTEVPRSYEGYADRDEPESEHWDENGGDAGKEEGDAPTT